jgi:hypothetical protein
MGRGCFLIIHIVTTGRRRRWDRKCVNIVFEIVRIEGSFRCCFGGFSFFSFSLLDASEKGRVEHRSLLIATALLVAHRFPSQTACSPAWV